MSSAHQGKQNSRFSITDQNDAETKNFVDPGSPHIILVIMHGVIEICKGEFAALHTQRVFSTSMISIIRAYASNNVTLGNATSWVIIHRQCTHGTKVGGRKSIEGGKYFDEALLVGDQEKTEKSGLRQV